MGPQNHAEYDLLTRWPSIGANLVQAIPATRPDNTSLTDELPPGLMDERCVRPSSLSDWDRVEPPIGFEPMTYALRERRSTD